MTVSERNFYFPRYFAVLPGNDQLDSPEMVLRKAVVEDLQDPIETSIELSLLTLGEIRAVKGMWHK